MQTTDIVRAWAATVAIPTYGVGTPDRNPMFLEKRVYQGSSGAVYPFPVIDRVLDDRHDRAYTALYLENAYLKIMILPELGGRVQMALDKTNGHHFVYYNQVIKPALVGLTGPWISGGIEFNWPQHHRPSTFEPLEHQITESSDGSKTVWCSEIERMTRTKGTVGFTLHPGRAYLALDVRLFNRTSEPQSFLWWTNSAVHVSDSYRSIFPPDVHAVMDHGRRDVSDFPIATGTYYKVDYAPGTDISRWSTIPVPTSYMACHSNFDFLGGYDDATQAGTMLVADHHVVPGKKQWTWGNGDFGRAWERQLTDSDGPYVELMVGAYTDNQPDFSWIMPGEEKRFKQYFLPFKAIGGAKNASRDAVLTLTARDGRAHLGVYVTQPRTVVVRLLAHGKLIHKAIRNLSPAITLNETVNVGRELSEHDLTLEVWSADALLLRVAPLPSSRERASIPAPAKPALPPREIASNEELYLNGLHLEQYRHPTLAPEPYYAEALRRDPGDSRCNNAMGALLHRRGKFAQAEPYFRRAIARLTVRNPNPYDGGAYYNLGLTLRMLGRYDEAFDAFHKAVWNDAWRAPAYYELARLATRRGEYERALELAERALETNAHHHRARHLQIALLRHLMRAKEAMEAVELALALDPMEPGAHFERLLLQGETGAAPPFHSCLHDLIELALDYQHAGLFTEASALLDRAAPGSPMVRYFSAWIALQRGDNETALRDQGEARVISPDFCFPNQIECVLALEAAQTLDPDDARAPYYLGNFWYAHRQYDDAIRCWERSRALDGDFPTVHRNLGLAYMNKRGDASRAIESYERALALDDTDARVLFELDQLRRKLNDPPSSRLERLSAYGSLVAVRDDLTIEYVTLLNLGGQYARALDTMLGRTFHPWEGGEGKVAAQYVVSLVGLAKEAHAAERYDAALALLTRAESYPHNLGEGKLPSTSDNQIHYHRGLALEALGNDEQARQAFELSAAGHSTLASAMFYNDQPPDASYYRGLACDKLGRDTDARALFDQLVAYGEQHRDDDVQIDYFAVSLPDFLLFDEELSRRNRIHCEYMIGLGRLGLGQRASAHGHLTRVLALDPAHLGATIHLSSILTEATASA